MVLGRLAQSRWADERAAATGISPEEAMREFESEDADQRARELARIQGVLKREVAQGEAARVELRDLLSTSARERVQQLSKLGVGVVVLDECHHLASLWGYVIRAVLGELGDVHVVGLTPTPPVGLPESEAELYAALLGPVDFTVPTPAVVRDGQLAPYQELVWLTEPVAAERAYLAEHDARFLALTEQLRADGAFTEWVRDALPKRPRLARAAAPAFSATGAPRLERQPPDLEDWLRLLEVYAVRHLAPQDAAEARDRYDEIALALRELGFELTSKGVPRGPADADRLLTGSQAKTAGLLEVLSAEAASRRERFRGLVLCDLECRPAQRRRAECRPGPQRGHRPPRAAHARRRPADRAHAPADALHPRPALRARGRRGPARGAARGGRGALRAARVGGGDRGPAGHAALLRRGVDAARVDRAGHGAARRGASRPCSSAPASCSATSGSARR